MVLSLTYCKAPSNFFVALSASFSIWLLLSQPTKLVTMAANAIRTTNIEIFFMENSFNKVGIADSIPKDFYIVKYEPGDPKQEEGR